MFRLGLDPRQSLRGHPSHDGLYVEWNQLEDDQPHDDDRDVPTPKGCELPVAKRVRTDT